MKTRSLGSTGINVSEIAFGGVEIGMPYGTHKDRQLTDSEAIDLLHEACDKGINFFDTARMYGRSEEIMGSAFSGMREKVVLCTKCEHLKDSDGNLKTGKNVNRFIEGSIETSLKELQTDHVDVFLSHTADDDILKNDEIVDGFKAIKEKGLARAVGVSTYGFKNSRTAIESGDWDVVQLSFNLMDQSCSELFPIAKEKSVGIMVRSVLMRGFLTEGISDFHEKLKSVENHLRGYRELLTKEICTLSDLAVKFVLSFDEVSAALVGIDRQQFLEEAVAVANNKYLSGSLFEKAKSMAYPDPDFLDLSVWDRKGWL